MSGRHRSDAAVAGSRLQAAARPGRCRRGVLCAHRSCACLLLLWRRAGITAFVLGCGFVVAMFFAPIFSSIPGFATGPALIVVGTLMIGHAREINWDDLKIAFPSFLTIALMPLTYSIAYGVLTGILANIVMWLFIGIVNMGIAAWRRDGVTTPWSVFYGMFQCWRDAFEDFMPGVKAEWKGVFSNKVTRRARARSSWPHVQQQQQPAEPAC